MDDRARRRATDGVRSELGERQGERALAEAQGCTYEEAVDDALAVARSCAKRVMRVGAA